MPSKRAPKRPGAIRSPPSQRPDRKNLDPQVPGYVVTKPRITPEGWLELDGGLIADAGLVYGRGKALT